MAEDAVQAEDAARASSVALAAHIAGLFEVGEDALRGAFGDAADSGDVAAPGGRVACDGEQHAGVVGKEAPLPGLPARVLFPPFNSAQVGVPAAVSRKQTSLVCA